MVPGRHPTQPRQGATETRSHPAWQSDQNSHDHLCPSFRILDTKPLLLVLRLDPRRLTLYSSKSNTGYQDLESPIWPGTALARAISMLGPRRTPGSRDAQAMRSTAATWRLVARHGSRPCAGLGPCAACDSRMRQWGDSTALKSSGGLAPGDQETGGACRHRDDRQHQTGWLWDRLPIELVDRGRKTLAVSDGSHVRVAV